MFARLVISFAVLLVSLPLSQAQTSEDGDPLESYLEYQGENFLIEGVKLVDVGNGTAGDTYDVLLLNGWIARVAPAGSLEASEGTIVVAGHGKTLIPGLVGMHNHLHMPGAPSMAAEAARLYLASGVTTIQTAGSADPIGELALQRDIEAGLAPGPRIASSAPYITGPGGNGPMEKPLDELAARRFVDEWAGRGVSTIKLYRHTDPVIAEIIIEQAHKRGLRVAGHLCSITYEEAARMGIDSIEHGLHPASDFVAEKSKGVCIPSVDAKAELAVNDPRLDELISILVEKNVALTSTLAIQESRFPQRPQADDRVLDLLAPHLAEASRQRTEAMAGMDVTPAISEAYWGLLLSFERRFVKAGGTLLAGPDTGRHVLPGLGDQRNFELLREAGFSTQDVLKIMSQNGADALGLGKEIGGVQTGRRAELVLLNGNLEADPSIIREVVVVFNGGRAYDPARLIMGLEGMIGK